MKKYAIKKPSTRPGVWEWQSKKVEGSTYVEVIHYSTKQEAEAALAQWSPNNGQVSEVNINE